MASAPTATAWPTISNRRRAAHSPQSAPPAPIVFLTCVAPALKGGRGELGLAARGFEAAAAHTTEGADTIRCHAVQLYLIDAHPQAARRALGAMTAPPLWLQAAVARALPAADRAQVAQQLLREAKELTARSALETTLGHAATLHAEGAFSQLKALHQQAPVTQPVARQALAQHTLRAAISLIQRYERLPVPNRIDDNELARRIKQKADALQAADRMLRRALTHRNLPANLEAMYRIGRLYEQFALWLYALPTSEMDEEYRDTYRPQLEELAAPITEKAIQAWRAGLRIARQRRTSSRWTRLMDTELTRLDPNWARPWAQVIPSGPWIGPDRLPRRIRIKRGRRCSTERSN